MIKSGMGLHDPYYCNEKCFCDTKIAAIAAWCIAIGFIVGKVL